MKYKHKIKRDMPPKALNEIQERCLQGHSKLEKCEKRNAFWTKQETYVKHVFQSQNLRRPIRCLFR